ncbi:lantibiotic dehydratase [Pontibacter indicus]|uniref:Thiopeptide-type bacteriocin biosynthesis domain-containing protein n=1 Tax=Pontibacter indicus TaxID=1317125 RepID=A0A1R3XUC7_9BACT|nr:lantibiotic dehydratase [Pontibacter indicus]SIT95245.1 thiopeptide-type bacteriocin biosynthesis domain-containing protein [Pontibacter indicus]
MDHFYNRLLLRIPAYPHPSYRETDLSEHLGSPFFRAALQLASPALFQELAKHAFEAEALPPRVLLAVRKYLNRMCFRPTPFGLFSGFAVADWTDEPHAGLWLNGERLQAHAQLSFRHARALAGQLLGNAAPVYDTYQANGSRYQVAGTDRFLRFEEDQEKGDRTFYVEAVERLAPVQTVLNFCREPRPREAILTRLMQETGVSAVEGEAFLEQLIAQQLLVSVWQPAVTGDDYLLRVWQHGRQHLEKQPLGASAASLLARLQQVVNTAQADELGGRLLAGDLAWPGAPAGHALYLNMERQVTGGGVPESWQEPVREALEAIGRLVSPQQPPGLRHFREAFLQKFDRRAIPLLEALDPEVGVGYAELAGSFQVPHLLDGFVFDTGQQQQEQVINWTPAHSLLLETWQAQGNVPTLALDLEQVRQLPAPVGEVAPSLSVLFRVLGEQVYIEQAGGASATALLGRFTPLSPAIGEMALAIAEAEQEANPDVIFAEIAHLSEAHTANIDRRSAVRAYEIPVLVAPGVAPEGQLPLEDLLVWVENDEIILWSRRLARRVIPRLGSAYNYTRNDLAVFRFLCDVQYQGIRTNFSFNLRAFFPDLPYYPRVSCGGAILSLASWHLRREELAEVLNTGPGQQVARLQTLAAARNWPRQVALTVHDHQLVFDLGQAEEVRFFLAAIEQEKAFTLREFPFAGEEAGLVRDEKGQVYVHQLLAAVFHRRAVYQRPAREVACFAPALERKRRVMPGGEWLYWKLYGHPARANELLIRLQGLLARLKKQGLVRQWYFVRYRDPGYHLRLRVQPGLAWAAAFERLSTALERLVRTAAVQDLVLAVYERELERYASAPGILEATESFFCADSALVTGFLRATGCQETEPGYYRFAVETLDLLLTDFGLTLAQKESLLDVLFQAFYREHGGGKALKQQLSRRYRALCQEAVFGADAAQRQACVSFRGSDRLLANFKEALVLLRQRTAGLPHLRLQQLLADLVHMHLNRLLVDDARKQELVLYYGLQRAYQSTRARQQKPSSQVRPGP